MPRPFVSPDGRYLAFSQTGGNLVIVDVADPTSPRSLSGGSTLMAWSPDSRYLAYGRGTLYLYDTLTNRSRAISSTISRGVHNITWSPDGRYIGFSCCFTQPEGEYIGIEDGEIKQYNVESGLFETVGETINSVGGGSPTLCWQEAGYFVPYQEGQQINYCTLYGSWLSSANSSPDGEKFAWMLFSSEDDDPLHLHQLTVNDNETDEILWQLVLEEAVNRLAWSVDGRYLLLNNYYPGLSPIWRLLANGESTPEALVEDAFLIGVVPMWQEGP
jgi:WD40 repeat protein